MTGVLDKLMSFWRPRPLQPITAAPVATAAIQAAPPPAAIAGPPASDLALMRIIRPESQPRWIPLPIASYTPQLIETILRGAMAGNLIQIWELFDLMEATWPRLQKNLMELKDEVASVRWTVQPWTIEGEEPTPEAVDRAKALSQAIWSMRPDPAADENDFRGTIKDTLDAWGKGIALLELNWEYRPLAGGGPSAVCPQSTNWIHPVNYGFGPSSRLQLNLTQPVFGPRPSDRGGWMDFPPNKFLICVAKQKSGHPAGSSLLRALAWWWCAANFSAEWLLNFAQIFGLPIRWANYDASRPGLLTDISNMLENMGSAGWGAFPAGTTIELKESAKTGETIPQASLMDRADRQCDILILGQTLTTDVAQSGSRALGQVHAEVLAGRKKAAADWVASVLNAQFAPAFCRLNYGDDSMCPQLVPEPIETEDPLIMAQRDQILHALIDLPKEWLYERHTVPIPGPEDDVIPASSGAAPLTPEDQSQPETPAIKAARAAIEAKNSLEKLTDNVLENLTGIEAKWLGGVRPWFRRLIDAARNDQLTDTHFLAALDAAQKQLPELFGALDAKAVEKALNDAMSAALINGAVKGALKRK